MHNDSVPSDMDAPATKGDVAAVKTEVAVLKTEVAVVKTDMAALRTELKEDHNRLVKYVLDAQARTEKAIEELRADMADKFSRMLAQIEGFMVQTLKADRGHTLLGHRVDLLENRVKILESHRRQPPRRAA